MKRGHLALRQRAGALCTPTRTRRLPDLVTALSMWHGFSNVFFLFPSPPQKRVQERGAALARERQSGTTLFINLGWGGLLPI